MLPIPEPQLGSLPPEPEWRIRFKFKHLRKTGNGSRKDWGKQSKKARATYVAKFREYGRMTLKQFRSSDGVQLKHRKYKSLVPPKSISEDVAAQKWLYFRLSGKARVIGLLVGHYFLVHAIDFDHTMK